MKHLKTYRELKESLNESKIKKGSDIVKIMSNPIEWGSDMKDRVFTKGNNFIFADTFYYGQQKALDDLIKSWSPGGNYYEYFKDNYGIELEVVASFSDFKAKGKFKKLTDDGVVYVELAIKNIGESLNEEYDGNLEDFKYELEQALVDELGLPIKAIKKVSKKGKGYEVRMSSYMSQKETWEELAKVLGLELKNFEKGNINVGIFESVNEAATVKDEAIERLADFFRVSPNALKKFNFDGKDNIKELTKALNSTSDHGTEMYYKVAIDMAKKDLGINEREYSEDERKSMADKGLALPDGSFPIKDLEDLKNAIQAYGRSKNQSAAAKFIAKRAKELGADDLIPDTDDFKKSLKEIDSAEPFINEAINIKDIGAGSVLNFKDGEVWIVTKVIGNASNPRGYFAKPHDEKTKKANTSVEIELTPDFLKKELESINEAYIGPFVFNDSTDTDELKSIYNDAVNGYANWQKGFQYPKSDYKKAYQTAEKILKKRGIKVDESESLDEATTSWSKMMKGVKTSESGPWSLVAIEGNKVVAQEIDIRDRNILPASFEMMRKKWPKAKIHIEDGTGMVVWSEK